MGAEGTGQPTRGAGDPRSHPSLRKPTEEPAPWQPRDSSARGQRKAEGASRHADTSGPGNTGACDKWHTPGNNLRGLLTYKHSLQVIPPVPRWPGCDLLLRVAWATASTRFCLRGWGATQRGHWPPEVPGSQGNSGVQAVPQNGLSHPHAGQLWGPGDSWGQLGTETPTAVGQAAKSRRVHSGERAPRSGGVVGATERWWPRKDPEPGVRQHGSGSVGSSKRSGRPRRDGPVTFYVTISIPCYPIHREMQGLLGLSEFARLSGLRELLVKDKL